MVEVPEDIVREILIARVSLSLTFVFDPTTIPPVDEQSLVIYDRHHRDRIDEHKNLVQLLTVCRCFALLLPPLIYQRIKVLSPARALSLYAMMTKEVISGAFATHIVHLEFQFPTEGGSTLETMAGILAHTSSVTTVALSYPLYDNLFIVPITRFVRSSLPGNVKTLMLRLQIDDGDLDIDLLTALLDSRPWSHSTWCTFFASIPHVSKFILQTTQYIVWPPFHTMEHYILRRWLSNCSSSLTTVELLYGHGLLEVPIDIVLQDHLNVPAGNGLSMIDLDILPPVVCSRYLFDGRVWGKDCAALPGMIPLLRIFPWDVEHITFN